MDTPGPVHGFEICHGTTRPARAVPFRRCWKTPRLRCARPPTGCARAARRTGRAVPSGSPRGPFRSGRAGAAQQLYLAAARLRNIRQPGLLAGRALEEVLSLARADRGNVQLADPASGALRIIAQHGFDQEFLDHFAVVDDDRSACGRAARHRAQLIITDVITDPEFTPHRETAAASGFRAVQSTPMVDKAGRLAGVVSTHYPRPYAPPPRDMVIIKRYADLVGQVLASATEAVPEDRPITA